MGKVLTIPFETKEANLLIFLAQRENDERIQLCCTVATVLHSVDILGLLNSVFTKSVDVKIKEI